MPDMQRFLEEDLGEWDDSTTILPSKNASAYIIAKEDCVISGLMEAAYVFEQLGCKAINLFDDGEYVISGALVMEVKGDVRDILKGERLALNFLGRMSGISTITRRCVDLASGVKVACTRKTTPGFRYYEKRAVKLGGGDPHRFNLSGAVMIKDNHISIMGLEGAIATAKQTASFTKKIEVEVETVEDLVTAAKSKVDIIMLDNMSPADVRRGIDILSNLGLRKDVILEASGGITPKDLAEYASAGVDVISLGFITRNARWIDYSMEMCAPDDV